MCVQWYSQHTDRHEAHRRICSSRKIGDAVSCRMPQTAQKNRGATWWYNMLIMSPNTINWMSRGRCGSMAGGSRCKNCSKVAQSAPRKKQRNVKCKGHSCCQKASASLRNFADLKVWWRWRLCTWVAARNAQSVPRKKQRNVKCKAQNCWQKAQNRNFTKILQVIYSSSSSEEKDWRSCR